MLSFDAYLNWLGIPPHEQPPNFYRLLGVVLFESNPEVIQQAADRQSLHVGSFQAGPQGEMCQQLMNEIAMAQFCLLNPQQKAAYDGQLYESLAQRGERAVAAPPPPASMGGAGQFSPPSPQFGPQVPMAMPGLAAMPGPAAMSMPSPQQPVMQMPPTLMSAPPGFGAPGTPGRAMPSAFAPAAMPAAAPFPTARPVAAATHRAAAAPAPAAPPANPPAAPQRPIDELESLTSQPTTRHRPLKKKQSTDYTKQIIIASVVGAVGVLLFIIFAAMRNNDRGIGAVAEPEKHPVVTLPKHGKEHKQNRIEREAETEREKPAAADHTATNHTAANHTAANGGGTGPLRPFGADAQPKSGSHSDDDYTNPHHFGPPTRTMDSPDPGAHNGPGPNPDGHDGPQDLGTEKDPVFETPK